MKIKNICLCWQLLKSAHRKIKRQRRCLKNKINELDAKVRRLEKENQRLIEKIYDDREDVMCLFNSMEVSDFAEGILVEVGSYTVYREGNRVYIR